MDYFKVSLKLFGEFDHLDDWDAAEEKEEGETTQGGDELNSLEDEKDELNTKTSTKCPVKHLEKNLDINFESFTAETLREFQASTLNSSLVASGAKQMIYTTKIVLIIGFLYIFC